MKITPVHCPHCEAGDKTHFLDEDGVQSSLSGRRGRWCHAADDAFWLCPALNLKCISLWQPWASAMAIGSKRVETRSWGTDYRGPVAIHAAKRCIVSELISFNCQWPWRAALAPLYTKEGKEHLDDILPFGAIIAVGDLVDCRPTDSFTVQELDTKRYKEGDKPSSNVGFWTERQMGDFSLGRFGWVFENMQRLETPIPYKGFQRLFNVDRTLIEANPFEQIRSEGKS